jgi:hypothetical protein
MRKQTNMAGKPIGLKPRYLLVPLDLEFTAMTILKSVGLPGGNNRDTNSTLSSVRGHPWSSVLGVKSRETFGVNREGTRLFAATVANIFGLYGPAEHLDGITQAGTWSQTQECGQGAGRRSGRYGFEPTD